MSPAMLDEAWLERHPLPAMDAGSDKNQRGRILVAGGAEFVPGALRLTSEAALRAGAGKLQMATVRSAAVSLGVLVPEAAMIALPSQQDGEIAPEAADLLIERANCSDAVILGPGMSVSAQTHELVAAVLAGIKTPRAIILDAAALTGARDLQEVIARHQGHVILTPHHGEMAILTGLSQADVTADPMRISTEIAGSFNAVVLLKGKESIIVEPGADPLVFQGGCVGLATGGSGDVLAGIVGGLAARGSTPVEAASWATWVHGLAGKYLESELGGVGFLARELLPLIPRVLNGAGLACGEKAGA